MVKTEYVMLNGVKYADVSGYARDLPPKRREKIERLRVEKDQAAESDGRHADPQ